MNILVTGVAGTGKTTLSKELKKRDYACIDDATNGEDLGAWFDLEGNRLADDVHIQDNFSWDNVTWDWDIERLEAFLFNNDTAIVTGYKSDLETLIETYFDGILLLNATADIINRRLSKRPFGYGYKQDERQKVLNDLEDLPEKLKYFDPVVINADLPVKKIADTVTEFVNETRKR